MIFTISDKKIVKKGAKLTVLYNSKPLDRHMRLRLRLPDRVGGERLIHPPSSHTTVRTVPVYGGFNS